MKNKIDNLFFIKQKAKRSPIILDVKKINDMVLRREELRKSQKYEEADYILSILFIHGVVIDDGSQLSNQQSSWSFVG